jgi:hypothetical protein
MTNLDAMCRYTLDRHHELLVVAARRRLLSNGSFAPRRHRFARPWRFVVARWLRAAADRLEPVADRPQVAMLRAVSHREISVDQALRLLDDRRGHRSATV